LLREKATDLIATAKEAESLKAERDELVRVLGVVSPFIDGKHSYKLAMETLAMVQK
jgi:hypothetical protein